MDRDRHDLARALLTVLPGALLDLADLRHGRPLRVVDHVGDQLFARLVRGHPRDPLEMRTVALGRVLETFPHEGQLLVALLELGRAEVELLGSGPQLVLRGRDPALQPGHLVPASPDVLFGLAPGPNRLLLRHLQGLLQRGRGLLLGLDEPLLRPGLRLRLDGLRVRSRKRCADQESDGEACREGGDADDDRGHGASHSFENDRERDLPVPPFMVRRFARWGVPTRRSAQASRPSSVWFVRGAGQLAHVAVG